MASIYPVSNINSFTTTAGTEAAVAVVYIPYDTAVSQGLVITGDVQFSAVNAATTALLVKVRQATFSGGHVVVTSPAGTQVGPTFSNTFTAGTLSTQEVGFTVIDQNPAALTTVDSALPSQVASNGVPGVIEQGGFLYVVTVTSTTNVATVAAGALVAVGWSEGPSS